MAGGPFWTEDEDEVLIGRAGTWSVARIARTLGRTEAACLQRLADKGVCVGEAQGYLSAQCAADEYGLSRKTVQRWARQGVVRARRGSHTWQIEAESLARLVRA